MFTVAKILEFATIALQKNDYYEYLKNGTPYPELSEDNDRFLSCYNTVIMELGEEHLPLIKYETIEGENNKFYYSSFSETPLEIKACYVEGIEVEFVKTPLYIECLATKLTIEYVYCPTATNFNFSCPYAQSKISKRIIGLGVIREYLLMSGMYEEAKIYDERFKNALESVLLPKKMKTMKARGWY